MVDWDLEIAGIYSNLEGEVLEIIIKRLKSGSKDIAEWQLEKLSELGLLNDDVIHLVSEASERSQNEVERAFSIGPNEVINEVDKSVPGAKIEPNNNIHRIINNYKNQAQLEIGNFVNQRLITNNFGSGSITRAYTQIINNATANVITGIHTLEQGVQKAVENFVEQGLQTDLRDSKGRTISVDTYVRNVVKTTLGRTYDEVRKEHMDQYGQHLVVVGSHAGARKACSKIQGQVVDLRQPEEIPEGSKYRSIYDPYWEAYYEEPSGHHGINCSHPHFVFVEGVNTNNQPQFDEELNEQVAKDQARQRSLERQIRDYKKKLKVAEEFGNEEDIARYKKLISGRQKALREHLKGHKYLSRDYSREKVY